MHYTCHVYKRERPFIFLPKLLVASLGCVERKFKTNILVNSSEILVNK